MATVADFAGKLISRALLFAGVAAAALAALVPFAPVRAAETAASPSPQPKRIVSLNLCTDQLLADLVPPERIAALSRLAADAKLSTIAARARAFGLTGGAAEDVLALDPDLIVTAEYAAPQTIALLRRLGRRVATIPMAQDFPGLRSSIRTLAALVGEPVRGEALIAGIDTRLAAATVAGPSPARRPTALAWQINGVASGGTSLIDAAMTAAGFDNAARALPLGPGGMLPLELIVANPPDVLVLANAPDDYLTTAADNLRHPALGIAMRGRQTVRLPMPLWLCASPRSVEAVEILAAVRDRIVSTRAPSQ